MRQVPEEYIVKMEQDILDAEGIFVHTPTAFAKDNLFYMKSAGPVWNLFSCFLSERANCSSNIRGALLLPGKKISYFWTVCARTAIRR